jgi:hypothetical protein
VTSRQRVEAALRHRPVDRTPYFEYVLLAPLADRLLGRVYAGDPDNWQKVLDAKGWEPAVRQMAIDRLDLAEMLGHDMIYAWANPPPPENRGLSQNPSSDSESVPDFPPEPPADDPVGRMMLRNERRAADFRPPGDDCFHVYVCLKEEMRKRGLDLPILAPAWAHGVWTDVDLMQTMVLEPAVAHRHFKLATQWSLAMIEKYIALGIEQIGVGGDFAGNRPLISPEQYRDFIMPEILNCTRPIHAAGRWAVNASDGDLWPVIEDYLIGCQVDGYVEIDMHAGMDLARLKRAYGSRVTFFGNLDCGNILSFATPEGVARHVTDCLRAGQGEGGHILCASNAITASVPLVNYLAAVNAYRQFFGLKVVSV